jgi:DmsE family decaheme c-type cytochrome
MHSKITVGNFGYIAFAVFLTAIFFISGSAIGGTTDNVGNEGTDIEPSPAISADAEYMGTLICLDCHADYKEGFLKTKHALSLGNAKAKPRDQGCEQCHGPSSLHMDLLDKDADCRGILSFSEKTFSSDIKTTCLRCHKSRIDAADWKSSAHNAAGMKCMDCHKVHTRKFDFQLKEKVSLDLCYNCHTTIKAEFETSRSHHPVNEETGCIICHDPHGEPDSTLRSNVLENKCARCHADTAGPFIFQHLTGTSDFGEGCASCHYPHSSSNVNLLKANGRGLCLSCHTDLAGHMGAATCWTSGCHSQIHGSNDNLLFIR